MCHTKTPKSPQLTAPHRNPTWKPQCARSPAPRWNYKEKPVSDSNQHTDALNEQACSRRWVIEPEEPPQAEESCRTETPAGFVATDFSLWLQIHIFFLSNVSSVTLRRASILLLLEVDLISWVDTLALLPQCLLGGTYGSFSRFSSFFSSSSILGQSQWRMREVKK